nr:DUF192 domain-containing protein [Halomonas cerina]
MRPTRRQLLLGLALLPATALWGPSVLVTQASEGLETVPLVVHGERGPQRLTVEVARRNAERSRGLMDRDRLAPDAGMLFLYDGPWPMRHGFWMYRTRIPLDIAFIDATGRILEIHRMTPCTAKSSSDCPITRPAAPYRAALEVNAGWFAAHGIVPGDCVSWPGDGGLCVDDGAG